MPQTTERAYRDITQYAIGTKYTHKSICKLIKRFKFSPTELDDQSVVSFFNTLKISRQNAGKLPYTQSYLSTIVSVIRRLNPNVTITAKQLGYARENSFRLMRESNVSNPISRDVCADAVKLIFDTFTPDIVKFRDPGFTRGRLEMSIAIVLVISTNMRTENVQQLRMCDLDDIKHGRIVQIKIKRRNVTSEILAFPILGRIYSALRRAIATALVLNGASRGGSERSNNSIKDTDFEDFVNADYQTSTFGQLFVMTCAKSTIQVEIKKRFIALGDMYPPNQLGLTTFKRINTTEILNANQEDLAAFVNRHRNVNTSYEHYSFPSAQDGLDAVMRRRPEYGGTAFLNPLRSPSRTEELSNTQRARAVQRKSRRNLPNVRSKTAGARSRSISATMSMDDNEE
jgi:transposase